jgi:predicted metal-dependent enzyme (double-stranded beta helix superfamily)
MKKTQTLSLRKVTAKLQLSRGSLVTVAGAAAREIIDLVVVSTMEPVSRVVSIKNCMMPVMKESSALTNSCHRTPVDHLLHQKKPGCLVVQQVLLLPGCQHHNLPV